MFLILANHLMVVSYSDYHNHRPKKLQNPPSPSDLCSVGKTLWWTFPTIAPFRLTTPPLGSSSPNLHAGSNPGDNQCVNAPTRMTSPLRQSPRAGTWPSRRPPPSLSLVVPSRQSFPAPRFLHLRPASGTFALFSLRQAMKP